jgi:hypothetical protein
MNARTADQVAALRQTWQTAVHCEQETNDAWLMAEDALDVARFAYRQALKQATTTTKETDQ